MDAIVVYDLGEIPVCADCRFADIRKEGKYVVEVGCKRVISTSKRDPFTGEQAGTNTIYAPLCRMSDALCGIDARWFKPKS